MAHVSDLMQKELDLMPFYLISITLLPKIIANLRIYFLLNWPYGLIDMIQMKISFTLSLFSCDIMIMFSKKMCL